ncbi:MAG: VOC family protein [Patescibacteria group bacterium]|nr:VOC family protein [Patescibacteria group bacterium]
MPNNIHRLSPHIRFPHGKCREGMEFYKSVFGGKLDFMAIGDAPPDVAKNMPNISKDNIMHASLDSEGFSILGADQMRDPVVKGDQVTIMVELSNQKEVDDRFAKLSEGGQVFMKPEKMFWGGYYGSLTDKYGVEWALHCRSKEEGVRRKE